MDKGEIQVPVFINGIVTDLPAIDFCMDGATHQIHSFNGATRLKGNSPEVTEQLEKAAGTKLIVTVAGYPAWGPECFHVRVYYVSSITDVMTKMFGRANL